VHQVRYGYKPPTVLASWEKEHGLLDWKIANLGVAGGLLGGQNRAAYTGAASLHIGGLPRGVELI
jgi:hypothetical protein